MFRIINISLGDIKSKVKQTIYFPYEKIERVIKMTSPCDCSVPVNDVSNSRVVVTYIPSSIPIHLLQKGITEVTVKKVITVEYISFDLPKEKQIIVLSFNATIKG